MHSKKKQQNNTFRRNEKVILLFLILTILVDIIISIVSIVAVQRQTTGYISTLLDSQSAQIDRELSKVNTELTRVLMENFDLEQKAISSDPLTNIGARIKLQGKLSYAFSSYSPDYTYFYLLDNDSALLRYNIAEIYDKTIERSMITIMRSSENSMDPVFRKWQIVKVANQSYAMKIIRYNNSWIGCYIPAEKLFAAVETSYQNIECYPALITPDGQVVVGDSWPLDTPLVFANMEPGKTCFTGLVRRWSAVISDQNHNTNFSLAIMAQGYGDFFLIVILQAALIFTALITAGVAIIITVYTRYKITRPIIRFTKGLKAHSDGTNSPALQISEIQELEELNVQFRNLMNEIKRLKIDIYEQELEKQKVQMDYMQLQIKPHFFLNNLTIIHSMAQKNQVSEIEQMSLATVAYLRYIFSSSMSHVLISDELNHIRNLFTIMKIRRSSGLESDIFQDEKTTNCLMPPLVIQTFVENSFKYAVLPEKELDISVSVTKENHESNGVNTAYVSIFITDNGPGFPREHLDLWERGENLKQVSGERIGITNARKRLLSLYGEGAAIKLYNGSRGGAVVEIELPFEEAKLEKEEGDSNEYIVGG